MLTSCSQLCKINFIGCRCSDERVVRKNARHSHFEQSSGGGMPSGTILAHKHTLYETYAGFFRALATESFSAVRHWLHPELERLIFNQCQKNGETSFLRSLRHGLGSASQRLRLGSSQADGAGQIRTQLLNDMGDQAGSVRFVLSGDGWRIYAVEVWTAPRAVQAPPQVPLQRATPSPQPPQTRSTALHRTAVANNSNGVPKMGVTNWFRKATAYH